LEIKEKTLAAEERDKAKKDLSEALAKLEKMQEEND
jgi:hypothetical protein